MLRIPRPMLLLFVVVLIMVSHTSMLARVSADDFDDVCVSLLKSSTDSQIRIGFVLLDLRDGAECSRNARESFRSASLYKLVVLVEAYRQRDNGNLSFDEPIALQPHHYQDDPPESRPSDLPVFSASEALRRMIVFSHNASASALMERLSPEATAAAPARLALSGTSLGSRFVTTPADMAQLLASLYRGELVSVDSSQEMLTLLRAQELNDLIPAALPKGTQVAHKTGLIEKYLHDAGIVYAPGGDYVFVILTRWQISIDQSYLDIHKLTSLTYTAFDTEPESKGPAVTVGSGSQPTASVDPSTSSNEHLSPTPIVRPSEPQFSLRISPTAVGQRMMDRSTVDSVSLSPTTSDMSNVRAWQLGVIALVLSVLVLIALSAWIPLRRH